MNIKNVLIGFIVAALVLFFASAFVVDETEQVVVTRFGRVVWTPKITPGLKFKLPFIEKAKYFPKNILEWDGEPGEINTQDKTYLYVDTFARWKIVEPVKFYKLVETERKAQLRLSEIINAQVRDQITSYPLIETVRKSGRRLDTFELGVEDAKNTSPGGHVEVGRPEIMRMVREQASKKLEAFGIEIVDVKIKRVNYTDKVRQSVYGRMIAERKQIAEKFRSEGHGEARKIQGEKEKELKRITSGAYKKAQKIKGKADATATAIYADAYSRDPEFYSFMKTLDVYKETLGKDASVVLSTDSELFKYLKESKKN